MQNIVKMAAAEQQDIFTVLKANSLIQAVIPNYTEAELSLINVFISAIQRQFPNAAPYGLPKIVSDLRVEMPLTEVREQANINDNNYAQLISDTINSLMSKVITLKNYKEIETGKTILRHDFVTISEFKIKSDSLNQNYKTVQITFTETFLTIALKNYNIKIGNYTPIKIFFANSIRGKNNIRLYEWLKLKKDMHDIRMTLAEAQEIFNDAHRIPFSHIVRIIERSQTSLKKVLPFTFHPYKEFKSIVFYLSQNEENSLQI